MQRERTRAAEWRKYRLLILGGTGEAAALAEAVCAKFGNRLDVVTSLAGRTKHPAAVAGEIRIGGFGGKEGLAEYLREDGIDLVIDATHPFAAQISSAAREACDELKVPRLLLARTVWQAGPGDNWIEAENADAAAKLLPNLGRRAFLTIGRRDLAPFGAASGCWFLVRLVEEPDEPLPLGRPGQDYTLILARGPFSVADERKLMTDHGIDVLVTKASGGAATAAKLIAARELKLPVILLRRPDQEPGDRAENIEQALKWLAAALARLEGDGTGLK